MQQTIDDFFNRVMAKVQNFQERLPDIVATEAINATVDNFRDESYFGEKWKPRKDKKNTKKLLVKSGILFKGGSASGSGPKVFTSQPGLVVIGYEVPYARVHNEGGTINKKGREAIVTHKRYKSGKFKGKTLFYRNNEKASFSQRVKINAYSITMPARKFLGPHPKLKKRMFDTIRDFWTEQYLNK